MRPKLLAILALLSLPVLPTLGQELVRTYSVHNNCPAAINLFVAGEVQTIMSPGSTFNTVADIGAGYWYTDANGGRYTGVGTMRAGFWETTYELIKDAGQINTGMKVAPRHGSNRDGTCVSIECDDASCLDTFIGVPPVFPPPTNPPPPFHSCGPATNITFDITFCPDGTFPPNTGVEIHPMSDDSKCLDVRGANFANGTPVQIYDCNGTGAQKWFFVRGSTKVRVAGTNFCLDAGSSPVNGVGLKIWQCYDNLPAQQWYYTTDNRIALENQGQCIDLTNGILTNSQQAQIWQCTDYNINQVWNI